MGENQMGWLSGTTVKKYEKTYQNRILRSSGGNHLFLQQGGGSNFPGPRYAILHQTKLADLTPVMVGASSHETTSPPGGSRSIFAPSRHGGVHPHPKNQMTRPYTISPANRKAIRKRNLKLLRLFDRDISMEAIGKKFNLSRERVRQIARIYHRPSRLPESTARKHALRGLKQVKLRAKQMVASSVIDYLSSLWRYGTPLSVIRKITKANQLLPDYRTLNDIRMAGYISVMRKRYPTQFPYRRRNHGDKQKIKSNDNKTNIPNR